MPRDLLLVPENVKRYRLISDINVFTYSKPFRKNPEKSSNEFEDLWIANHFLITAETFPGVLSRSEVIEKHVVESSPIVNAIQSIDAKNKDIVGMCKRCTEDPSSSHVNALTMALNGKNLSCCFVLWGYSSADSAGIIVAMFVLTVLQVSLMRKSTAESRCISRHSLSTSLSNAILSMQGTLSG